MDFVVFSDDWGRHPSSCQHLFRHLARRHRVLWVNTIGMRSVRADGFTIARGLEKFRQWAHPLRQLSDDFFVYCPPMLPVAGGAAGRINSRLLAPQLCRIIRRCGMHQPVLFSSVPTAAEYVGQLGEVAVVYYVTDDYRHWPGGDCKVIAEQDAKLTRCADLLLPVSEALSEGRIVKPAARVELLPHGVDLAHFAAVDAPLPQPAELVGISHPRLCFFGLIYEKVDLAMLARLARELPAANLVLLGPVKTDISALSCLPNVHVLGAKPYEQLPRYLRHVDVLLLPYVLDEQIRRSAPLKIRECLAVGKPVVAVDVPDLRRYGHLIHLAKTPADYITACRAACMNGRVRPAEMRAAIAEDSWEARARQLEHAIEGVVGASSVDGDLAGTRVQRCGDGGVWDAYVASSPGGCVWHRWGWQQAMRSAYGLSCHYLLACRGRSVVGALPLALQSSRLFGRRLVSLPWLDYAGILTDDTEAHRALLTAAVNLARQQDAELVLRSLIAESPGYQSPARTRTDKLAMALDLPVEAGELWRQFGAKVRNQIRKAVKTGLHARWAGQESLGEFYSVYSVNMRDLGSPPQSLGFFREVFRSFGQLARLLLVRQGQTTVAGGLVLAETQTWQVPWASSLRRFNHLCPSHLMYWTILSSACGQTPRFCFGRSSRDSGTYKFKAQWGARPVQLYWHSWSAEPGRPAGADADDSRIITLVQSAWRRAPACLARAFGPHIVKRVG